MTEQDEYFIYFQSCINSLNESWGILNTIHTQQKKPLIAPTFRYALILYCKPYKNSQCTIKKKRQLQTDFIPPEYLPLHERIILSRDKVHAHSDLTIMEAKLTVNNFKEQRYTSIIQNTIYGTEELVNLPKIVTLIEKTLDNMYTKEKELEHALTP